MPTGSKVAPLTSRAMTTWEIILAPGEAIELDEAADENEVIDEDADDDEAIGVVILLVRGSNAPEVTNTTEPMHVHKSNKTAMTAQPMMILVDEPDDLFCVIIFLLE